MPTSPTKTANTTLGRASKRVSSAFRNAFGPYRQTDEQTQATLETMRGWLEDDNVNMEDLLVCPSSMLLADQLSMASSEKVSIERSFHRPRIALKVVRHSLPIIETTSVETP